MFEKNLFNVEDLRRRCNWVRAQTIMLHGKCPATRIASSLSLVELSVALYYSGALEFRSANSRWDQRDRVLISKGHGSICLYPILADLGFFPLSELELIGSRQSFLGGIPDPSIPGYETINGSLGHGIGIGVGSAKFLADRHEHPPFVFVVVSDGELYEGSSWEALMLGGALQLKNLVVIVDNNATCMLGRTENVIPLGFLSENCMNLGWSVVDIDGHDVELCAKTLLKLKQNRALAKGPTLINARTVKGKGISLLEKEPLSHIMNLSDEQIQSWLKGNHVESSNLSTFEKFERSTY